MYKYLYENNERSHLSVSERNKTSKSFHICPYVPHNMRNIPPAHNYGQRSRRLIILDNYNIQV